MSLGPSIWIFLWFHFL